MIDVGLTLDRLSRFGARAALRSSSILLILAAWEILARPRFVSPLILPSPEAVFWALVRFATSGDLAYHGAATLTRALTGFIAAVICGVTLGTMMARIDVARRLLEPLFFFGNSIPKITLYPVFIFLFGLGDASKIALIFLECLYPITIQTLAGMRGAERVLVWAAQNYGASARQMLWNVLLPSAGPAIFAGVRIALPVSLILTIITEIIGDNRGLGYVVAFASASFEPERALAAIAVIGVVGFLFDRGLAFARTTILYWQKDAQPLA